MASKGLILVCLALFVLAASAKGPGGRGGEGRPDFNGTKPPHPDEFNGTRPPCPENATFPFHNSTRNGSFPFHNGTHNGTWHHNGSFPFNGTLPFPHNGAEGGKPGKPHGRGLLNFLFRLLNGKGSKGPDGQGHKHNGTEFNSTFPSNHTGDFNHTGEFNKSGPCNKTGDFNKTGDHDKTGHGKPRGQRLF